MKTEKTFMRSLVLLLVMTFAKGANAQTHWNYAYDATGNRIQRTVTTGSSARQENKLSATDLFPDGKVKAVLDRGGNRLKIETQGNNNADIGIYDLVGREIISRHSASETTVIDLSDLRRGTYILSVEMGNDKKTCKFNK